MIYLTGDCHGAYGRFSKRQRMRQPFVMTENDFVIICGDMGLVWADDREFVYNKSGFQRCHLLFYGCKAITRIMI